MKIEFDNTVTLLRAETHKDKNDLTNIKNQLKIKAPNYQYTKQGKAYIKSKGKVGWDGYTRLYIKMTPESISISTGLLPSLINGIRNCNISDLRYKPKNNPPLKSQIILREYQDNTVNTALNNNLKGIAWPRGVIKIATGGGKTEVAVALYEKNPVPTIFLVHRKDLLYQAINRFAKYGYSAGQIGDSVFNPNPTGVTIAVLNSIHYIFKNNDLEKINKFIKSEQIFFDEAHLIAANLNKGNLFNNISKQFRHAYYRWGLTATPFLKDNYSNLLLEGASGSILKEVTTKFLIDNGYLTPPEIRIRATPKVMGPKKWPECYESMIILNTPRNDIIIEDLMNAPKPCIIMCLRVNHAEILSNKAKGKGLNLPVITGRTNIKDRRKALESLRNGTLDHIVTSTIFDEGIDLPELKSIILAGAGNSEIKQLQRIGRGVRKHQGKHKFILYDYEDLSCNILKRHSSNRRKVWENEGFDIS